MSARFVQPIQNIVDASGDVRPGAKLSFFDAFTSTPRSVFSDSQLTTEFTQPVVSDGGGNFPEIFLDGGSYRAVYTDANDVNIDTWEPINGIQLTNTPLLFTRIVETFTASQGQTLINLANSYTIGENELQVFVNGIYQNVPENYTETSTTSITFTSGLDAGDNVLVSNLKNSNIAIEIEKQTATEGQTLFTLTTLTYEIGSNKLLVYINGTLQATPSNYSETSTTSVTFSEGLVAGDFVTFYSY